MNIDITKIPFSKYGSYLSVTKDEDSNKLIIRHIRRKWDMERTFFISFRKNTEEVNYDLEVFPYVLNVSSSHGNVRIYMKSDEGLVIEGEGLEILIDTFEQTGAFGYAEPGKIARYKYSLGGVSSNACIDIISGSAEFESVCGIEESEKEVLKTIDINQVFKKNTLSVKPEDNKLSVFLRISNYEKRYPIEKVDSESEISEVKKEWQDFLEKMPEVPEKYRDYAEFAWYILWSCYLRSEGLFKYDALVMSKGRMAAVWSWDHCFNALALSKTNLKAGLEQLFLMFEVQNEFGQLPDMIDTTSAFWQITKPPIHGWCFKKIMDAYELETTVLEKAYKHLETWTNWFFEFRDTDHDGIPNYNVGCDSGWDNSTLFDIGGPLETADLSAFIYLQMKVLEEIASKLGWLEKAVSWNNRADELLNKLYDHLWTDKGFVAKKSGSHEFEAEPTSMLSIIPLVLGEYLTEDKLEVMVNRLLETFITPYGIATEDPKSAKYYYDGYWRGPSWAPVIYLIADGLKRAGKKELATRLAENFSNAVQKSGGFYENYNALTGEGLRDIGYTWTSSVYLLLLNEYIL